MNSDPSNPTAAPPKRPGILARVLHRAGGPLFFVVLLLVIFDRWPVIREALRGSGSTMPADGIAWGTDYHTALAQSALTGKPVLLDFSASWCGPCQAMKRETWPDAKVGQLVKSRFIPVLLDIDQASVHALSARYQVDSIPRVLIVDSEGRVLRDGSFMSSDEMVEFLSPTSGAK